MFGLVIYNGVIMYFVQQRAVQRAVAMVVRQTASDNSLIVFSEAGSNGGQDDSF